MSQLIKKTESEMKQEVTKIELYKSCGFDSMLDLYKALQEHIAWAFDDVPEIGSSDINCVMHDFFKDYGIDSTNHTEVSQEDWLHLRKLAVQYWI